MLIKSFLAKQLRCLRQAAGLTQGDVSRRLHIERQTYSNYENESRTPPLELIVRLADFYQVSVDDLVKEPPSEPPSPKTVLPAHEPPLSATEQSVLDSFRALSAQSQKETLQFIQFKAYLDAQAK